ncbi:MAG: AraC family transcriptional regulator [Promicromonosporaceae bacterium]|nr:AraC family transcriptional regulator [Promicromonosporaceae bacterium]
MDWIERMNAAVAYLEERLTEEIDVAEVAKIAYCSPYHFQRIFACMTSTTVAEYLRRRRMSLAVADLREPGARVIDVATKYGYNSPTAFNRAFQSVHGVAPSLVRFDGVAVKSYPPISFTVTITGREALEYRIEESAPFRVVGVSISAEMDEDSGQNILQLWQVAEDNGTIARLRAMNDGQPAGLLSVMVPEPDGGFQTWRYILAVASSETNIDGLEEYTIEAYTWAVFGCNDGSVEARGNLWERIFNEWLPTSGYEYADGPDMEVYQEPPALERGRFEVRIPVRKAETRR